MYKNRLFYKNITKAFLKNILYMQSQLSPDKISGDKPPNVAKR